MSEWTPERIASARDGLDRMARFVGAHGSAEITACRELDDIFAAAVVGLAVLEADDATVTRLARAIYDLKPYMYVQKEGRMATWKELTDDEKIPAISVARAVLLELGKGE